MEFPPRSKCLFCLDPLEGDANYIDSSLLSTLIASCFQKHHSTSFAKSLEEATYCSLCFGRISEIHTVQTNLTQIQQELAHLTGTLKAYVMEKCKTFREDESESPQILKLRIQLYKLLSQSECVQQSNTELKIRGSKEVAETKRSSSAPNPDAPKNIQKSTLSMTRPRRLKKDTDDSTRDMGPQKRRALQGPGPFLSIPRISIGDVIIKTEPEEDNTDPGILPDLEDDDVFETKKITRRGTRRKANGTSSSSKPVNPLRCTYSGCSKTFPTENRRFAHIRHDHGGIGSRIAQDSKSFPCEQCDRSFTTTSRLDLHKRAGHENPKKEEKAKGLTFACTVSGCARKFSNEGIMFAHIKKTHEGLTSFKCEHCDKTYSKPSKLRIHQRTHTGEQPFECPTCQKRFSAKQYLRQHLSLHSNKFACEICGKRCASLVSLQYHVNTHSGSAKPFICELCGYSCTTKQYLRIHQANQHQGETDLKAIKCLVCGKCFSSKQSLQSHSILIHKIGKAKFNCQQCSSAFTNDRELRIHTNNVHLNLKRFECMICNKKCSTRGNLRMHHDRNHIAKEERPRPFECNTCARRFFIKKTLENHVAIHTAERPFPCDQCNLRFPSKSYLNLHQYTIHDKRKKKKNSNLSPGESQHQTEDGQESTPEAEPVILGN